MNGLIVGCGYLGQHVARRWIEQGHRVFAITRSNESAARLAQLSIQPIVVDWYDRDRWPKLPDVEQLLISVSHAPVTGIQANGTHVLGLRNLFAQLESIPSRLAYLSTTGVYETCDDGRWIDESGSICPNRPGSIAALAAERWLAENLPVDRVSIVRAAGIYGPGRIPRLDKLLAGEPIEVDPESYLNLIHVEDLAGVVVALLNAHKSHGIFNVSDGQPPRRCDYYRFIAKFIGAAVPRFREPALQSHGPDSVTQQRRGEGNKRISNRRVIETLDYQMLFPEFIAGLTPLLQSDIGKDHRKIRG